MTKRVTKHKNIETSSRNFAAVGSGKRKKDKDAFRVRFWNADYSGCGFDRGITGMESLNKRSDWDCSYGTMLRGQDVQRYDLIIGQRVSTEETYKLWQMFVHPMMPATALDVDDNLFAVEPTNVGAYEMFNNPETQTRMAAALWLSDAVIASCEPLRQTLLQFNPNIYVLPNYLPKRHLRAPRRRTGSALTVTYAGGSSHAPDVAEAASSIVEGMERNPLVTFRNYGQDFRPLLPVPRMEYEPWFPNKDDYLQALDADIGLCPLRDSEFNRCKTPVKALEYAFRGIPTIASNVTPYKEYVIDGVTGFLVEPDGWADAIDELVNNDELRNRMADAAYEFAHSHTAEGHADERAEIFEQIICFDRDTKEAKYEHIINMGRQRQ